MPLALLIVAALLAEDPTRSLAAMVTELGDEYTRLDELRYDDVAVRAVFELSCRRLRAEPARLFRLLPLNPGPDISTSAVAALSGLDPSTARRGLEELARAHLIERGIDYGRWRMHDLVRLYAARDECRVRDPDELSAATAALMAYYLTTARAAARHLSPPDGSPADPTFSDLGRAVAWLDTEYANLVAAVRACARDEDQHEVVLELPMLLGNYLVWRRHFEDQVALLELSVRAADRIGDRTREAGALTWLGDALGRVERFDEAVTAHRKAVDLYRESGFRYGEGGALVSLALTLNAAERFDEATEAFDLALGICRDDGDRHGEVMVLHHFGLTLSRIGRVEEAIGAHRRVVDFHRNDGNRHGEARALLNLGGALLAAGRPDEATLTYGLAAEVFAEVDDRRGESWGLSNLADALSEAGRFAEAIEVGRRDLEICRELGDRHGSGEALCGLGRALRETGRFDEAVAAGQEAARIFHEIGDEPRARDALEEVELARRSGAG